MTSDVARHSLIIQDGHKTALWRVGIAKRACRLQIGSRKAWLL